MFIMMSATCLPNFIQIGLLLKELRFFNVGFYGQISAFSAFKNVYIEKDKT